MYRDPVSAPKLIDICLDNTRGYIRKLSPKTIREADEITRVITAKLSKDVLIRLNYISEISENFVQHKGRWALYLALRISYHCFLRTADFPVLFYRLPEARPQMDTFLRKVYVEDIKRVVINFNCVRDCMVSVYFFRTNFKHVSTVTFSGRFLNKSRIERWGQNGFFQRYPDVRFDCSELEYWKEEIPDWMIVHVSGLAIKIPAHRWDYDLDYIHENFSGLTSLKVIVKNPSHQELFGDKLQDLNAITIMDYLNDLEVQVEGLTSIKLLSVLLNSMPELTSLHFQSSLLANPKFDEFWNILQLKHLFKLTLDLNLVAEDFVVFQAWIAVFRALRKRLIDLKRTPMELKYTLMDWNEAAEGLEEQNQ